MTVPAITMEELLVWNDEASRFWKAHLDANPELLALPCDIGGADTVQGFIRHIWGVELRWAQRLTSMPETPREAIPAGPLQALFDLHLQAHEILQKTLADPAHDWDATFTMSVEWIPVDKRTITHRKMLGHALLHGQRHWAQLASLVRSAGFPSKFGGDLLFTSALR